VRIALTLLSERSNHEVIGVCMEPDATLLADFHGLADTVCTFPGLNVRKLFFVESVSIVHTLLNESL